MCYLDRTRHVLSIHVSAARPFSGQIAQVQRFAYVIERFGYRF
jgi:hypothetical protein